MSNANVSMVEGANVIVASSEELVRLARSCGKPLACVPGHKGQGYKSEPRALAERVSAKHAGRIVYLERPSEEGETWAAVWFNPCHDVDGDPPLGPELPNDAEFRGVVYRADGRPVTVSVPARDVDEERVEEVLDSVEAAVVPDVKGRGPTPAKGRGRPPAGELSTTDAAARVLADGQPRSCRELLDAMRQIGWKSTSRTPLATVRGSIYSEMKNRGDDARFVIPTRGRFALAATN